MKPIRTKKMRAALHGRWLSTGVVGLCVCACRPSDVLSVPPPANVVASSALQSQAGAELAFAGAKGTLFTAFAGASSSNNTGNNAGFVQWGGLLSDEFAWSDFATDAVDANIDARSTIASGGFAESGDNAVEGLLGARSALLLAQVALQQFEPPSGRSKVAEAYALAGYAEVFLAEEFCAGVPLSAALPNGGIEYGKPLTTDSLLGAAEAHFDSALAYAGGDATVGPLASVGLARTRLDRGDYAAAAQAANSVPTSFVYEAELEPTAASGTSALNLYATQFPANQGYPNCGSLNVSDREGQNGLNFLSANDQRLVIDSTLQPTCDGVYGGATPGTWYYPTKFGIATQTDVPLATGVEARLIEAEAALQATQVGAWAAALNALRADAPSTYLALAAPMDPLPPDSTTGASATTQVDVMFRERAFWLFGTGTRLGDLRRLIRQDDRAANTVFPVGAYPNGRNPSLPSPLPEYGTDVNLTLPTAAGQVTTPNPYYKGCLTNTKTA